MSEIKRALEDGVFTVLEVTEGDQGKPVITIRLKTGEVVIYESLATPGELVVEIDSDEVAYLAPENPVPNVRVYRHDVPQ